MRANDDCRRRKKHIQSFKRSELSLICYRKVILILVIFVILHHTLSSIKSQYYPSWKYLVFEKRLTFFSLHF